MKKVKFGSTHKGKKRFAEGGEVDYGNMGEDERPAPTGMGEIARLVTPKDTSSQEESIQKSPDSKKETFKEAFAAARKAGAKGFTWNNKRYSTELAPKKEKASAPRHTQSDVRKSEPPNKEKAPAPRNTQSDVRKSEPPKSAAPKRSIYADAMDDQRRFGRKVVDLVSGRGTDAKMPVSEEKRKLRESLSTTNFAKGGSVRGCGVAQKGKTKGSIR